MSNVVHLPISVGEATKKVVSSVAIRTPFLMENLQGAVSILNARTPQERAAREEEFRLLKIQQGKELITNGLNLIRDNESADAAILHLRETLAALDPTFEA